jgi:deoxyinosine 3'endonuclease (endonuclease V)
MFDEFARHINIMDSQDLDRVVNLVKARREMIAQIHKAQFIVGMDVEFEDKSHNTVYGSVIAINRKNMKIRSTSGTTWTVWPCFVRKSTNA